MKKVEERLEILKPRETKEVTEYERFFQRIDDYEGNGYSFPCDKDGNLEPLSDVAAESFSYCKKNPALYKDMGVVGNTRTATNPALAKCVCGNKFFLENQYMGACECPGCGRWYNLFGQELKNPEYWEDDDLNEEIRNDKFYGNLCEYKGETIINPPTGDIEYQYCCMAADDILKQVLVMPLQLIYEYGEKEIMTALQKNFDIINDKSNNNSSKARAAAKEIESILSNRVKDDKNNTSLAYWTEDANFDEYHDKALEQEKQKLSIPDECKETFLKAFEDRKDVIKEVARYVMNKIITAADEHTNKVEANEKIAYDKRKENLAEFVEEHKDWFKNHVKTIRVVVPDKKIEENGYMEIIRRFPKSSYVANHNLDDPGDFIKIRISKENDKGEDSNAWATGCLTTFNNLKSLEDEKPGAIREFCQCLSIAVRTLNDKPSNAKEPEDREREIKAGDNSVSSNALAEILVDKGIHDIGNGNIGESLDEALDPNYNADEVVDQLNQLNNEMLKKEAQKKDELERVYNSIYKNSDEDLKQIKELYSSIYKQLKGEDFKSTGDPDEDFEQIKKLIEHKLDKITSKFVNIQMEYSKNINRLNPHLKNFTPKDSADVEWMEKSRVLPDNWEETEEQLKKLETQESDLNKQLKELEAKHTESKAKMNEISSHHEEYQKLQKELDEIQKSKKIKTPKITGQITKFFKSNINQSLAGNEFIARIKTDDGSPDKIVKVRDLVDSTENQSLNDVFKDIKETSDESTTVYLQAKAEKEANRRQSEEQPKEEPQSPKNVIIRREDIAKSQKKAIEDQTKEEKARQDKEKEEKKIKEVDVRPGYVRINDKFTPAEIDPELIDSEGRKTGLYMSQIKGAIGSVGKLNKALEKTRSKSFNVAKWRKSLAWKASQGTIEEFFLYIGDPEKYANHPEYQYSAVYAKYNYEGQMGREEGKCKAGELAGSVTGASNLDLANELNEIAIKQNISNRAIEKDNEAAEREERIKAGEAAEIARKKRGIANDTLAPSRSTTLFNDIKTLKNDMTTINGATKTYVIDDIVFKDKKIADSYSENEYGSTAWYSVPGNDNNYENARSYANQIIENSGIEFTDEEKDKILADAAKAASEARDQLGEFASTYINLVTTANQRKQQLRNSMRR